MPRFENFRVNGEDDWTGWMCWIVQFEHGISFHLEGGAQLCGTHSFFYPHLLFYMISRGSR